MSLRQPRQDHSLEYSASVCFEDHRRSMVNSTGVYESSKPITDGSSKPITGQFGGLFYPFGQVTLRKGGCETGPFCLISVSSQKVPRKDQSREN